MFTDEKSYVGESLSSVSNSYNLVIFAASNRYRIYVLSSQLGDSIAYRKHYLMATKKDSDNYFGLEYTTTNFFAQP